MVKNKCYYCGRVIVRAATGNWTHRKTGIAACNRGDRHDPTPPQAKPAFGSEQDERDYLNSDITKYYTNQRS